MANPLPIIALLLAASVILSGAHAKDIAALPGDTQKVAHEDQQVKITPELHNHVDKGGKSFVKAMGDTPQADHRSLRLRDKKQSLKFRLSGLLKQRFEDVSLTLS